jgi:glyoxylase I family protein
MYGAVAGAVVLVILATEVLRRRGVEPTVAAAAIGAVVALVGAAFTFVKDVEAKIADRAEATARKTRLAQVEQRIAGAEAAAPAAVTNTSAISRVSQLQEPTPFIHHVSIPVRDLKRSVVFYQDYLQLRVIERPDIDIGTTGAWFQLTDGQQLHLIENAKAKFRDATTAKLNVWQAAHFALRVTNLRDWYDRLKRRKLFLDIHPDVQFRRYPHFYTLDPDNHVIEINSEPHDA